MKLGAVGLMLLLISMGGGVKKSQDVAGYATAWLPLDGVNVAADVLKLSRGVKIIKRVSCEINVIITLDLALTPLNDFFAVWKI